MSYAPESRKGRIDELEPRALGIILESLGALISQLSALVSEQKGLQSEIESLKELIRGQAMQRGRLYSLKEIAALTGLHENSIKQGMYDGRYKAYRHGTALRFDLDEIREAMRQQAEG